MWPSVLSPISLWVFGYVIPPFIFCPSWVWNGIDRKIELYCCVGLVESFTVCKDLNMAQSRKLYLLIFKKQSTSSIRVSRMILNASEALLVRIVEADDAAMTMTTAVIVNPQCMDYTCHLFCSVLIMFIPVINAISKFIHSPFDLWNLSFQDFPIS